MATTTAISLQTIKVGDGVTYGVGSDRYAATVTYVSPSGKTVRFTDDEYRRVDTNGYGGVQEYEYSSVPEKKSSDPVWGERTNARTARWNEAKGAFVYEKRFLTPGRRAYQDPSF